MEHIWIEEKKTISSEELREIAEPMKGSDDIYLAYCTDCFKSGFMNDGTFDDIDKDNLLELRIFNDRKEVLARRSSIGEPFSFRIASDEARARNYNQLIKDEVRSLYLPEKEDMLYSVEYQTLDINTDKSVQGNVISTVGGRFHLPRKNDETEAKIMVYYEYDEYGMAKAIDYRMCKFV